MAAMAEEEGEVPGGRVFRLEYDGVLMELLNRLGQMPLPPYIKEQLDDPEESTVYARHPGLSGQRRRLGSILRRSC